MVSAPSGGTIFQRRGGAEGSISSQGVVRLSDCLPYQAETLNLILQKGEAPIQPRTTMQLNGGMGEQFLCALPLTPLSLIPVPCKGNTLRFTQSHTQAHTHTQTNAHTHTQQRYRDTVPHACALPPTHLRRPARSCSDVGYRWILTTQCWTQGLRISAPRSSVLKT